MLNLVPRHRQIVARFVGPQRAPVLTRLIGVGELAIGVWMMSAIATPACVALQTVLVVTMNALELRYARDLLLAPRFMLVANTVLLAAAWLVAFRAHP